MQVSQLYSSICALTSSAKFSNPVILANLFITEFTVNYLLRLVQSIFTMLSHVSIAFSNQACKDLIFQIRLYAIKQNQCLDNCYFVLYAVKNSSFSFFLFLQGFLH